MRNYLTSMVISAVKPKVSKTSLDKAKSKLAIAIQKGKGSAAKLKQTLFESKNPKFKGKEFTFAPKGKAVKESVKKRNEDSKKIFKKALEKK